MIVCLVVLCISQFITGQTRYYTQLKIVAADRSEQKGDGSGQFITFNSNGCYDSDRDGCTVNNGFMNFGEKVEDRVYYSGSSYWGEAMYIFTENYRRLNIRITNSGTTYVYIQAAPSVNVTTCTLIKENKPVVLPPVIPPITFGNGSSSTTQKPATKTVTCTACKGSGRSSVKKYAPSYGGTVTYSRCSDCGDVDKPHYHDSCPSCMGKGYREVVNY